jgi:hypothetical protein
MVIKVNKILSSHQLHQAVKRNYFFDRNMTDGLRAFYYVFYVLGSLRK